MVDNQLINIVFGEAGGSCVVVAHHETLLLADKDD